MRGSGNGDIGSGDGDGGGGVGVGESLRLIFKGVRVGDEKRKKEAKKRKRKEGKKEKREKKRKEGYKNKKTEKKHRFPESFPASFQFCSRSLLVSVYVLAEYFPGVSPLVFLLVIVIIL